MNKKTIGQQALQGNATNESSYSDQTNNGHNNIFNLFNNFKTKIMNKNVFFIAIMLCASIFLLTGCQQEEISQPALQNQSSIPSDQLSKEQALKETLPVVQEFLNAQYDYLIGKDKTPRWNNYILSGGDVLQQQIDEYKENIYYSSFEVPVAYTSEMIYNESGANRLAGGIKSSFEKNGDTWVFKKIVDHFTLSQPVEGGPIKGTDVMEGGITYQTLVMKKDNGSWMIVSWEEHGLIGNSYRWYAGRERNMVIPEEEKNLSAFSKAAATTYNRTAAVIYAINYVSNPSSNYPDYSVAPYNGDCTNFVSQCLEAGGWTQISSGTKKWFHKKGSTTVPSTTYRSPSWTGAQDLRNFLSSSSRVASSPTILADLNIGDLIQLVYDGVAYHTTIVTSRSTINGVVVIKVHFRNGGSYSPQSNYNANLFPPSQRKLWKIANSYGLA